MPLSSRTLTREIMDGESFTSRELESNLADLERYNRIAGGTAGIRGALEVLAAGKKIRSPLKFLEVGAGAADIARTIARDFARSCPGAATPLVVGGDLQMRFLEYARRSNGGTGSIRLCATDARALPHADGSFHLAWSSLLIHHLDDAAIVASLSEMKRVTSLGFVVSDLRRSPMALALVWALTRLTTRSRLTLHDGPLSVRRALTLDELAGHALAAGLEPWSPGAPCGFEIRRRGPARMRLIYRHPAPGPGGQAGETA